MSTILTRWSEPRLANVHRHDRVKPVKAGVHGAGGFPPEAPLLGPGLV